MLMNEYRVRRVGGCSSFFFCSRVCGRCESKAADCTVKRRAKTILRDEMRNVVAEINSIKETWGSEMLNREGSNRYHVTEMLLERALRRVDFVELSFETSKNFFHFFES